MGFMRAEEFRTSLSGKAIPYVRDEKGELVPVSAAPLSWAQIAFLCAPEREVIAVGPRGGGKTETMILDFLQGVGRGWGRDYAGIIFRESQPQLRDIVKLSTELIKPIWPSARYNQLSHTWTFPNAETVEFFHFEHADDFHNLQGREFGFIGWEELCNWNSLEGYLKMFSCLRSTAASGMPRKVRATCNPMGPSHNAVKWRFRLNGIPQGICGPAITDSIGEDGEPEIPRRAIHFPYDDNVILRRFEPEYMRNVATACAGNPARLLAWTKGDWNQISGGAFDGIFFEHGDTIRVKRFDIPPMWLMFLCYDHGSTSPFSAGFYAESDGSDIIFEDGTRMSTVRGDLFRVGEVYGSQPGKWDVGLVPAPTIPQIVTAIQEYKIAHGWRWRDLVSGKWKDRCKKCVADSSIFDDMNQHTIADDFKLPVKINGEMVPGLSFERTTAKTPNSRIAAVQMIAERLIATKRPRENVPALFIVGQDCPAALATLPVLQRDEDHPEKLAKGSNDHTFDEIHYAICFDKAPGVWSGRIDQFGKRRAQ